MTETIDNAPVRRATRRGLRSVVAIAVVAVLALAGFAFAPATSVHRASAATIAPRAIDAFIIFSANASGITGEGATGGPGNIEVSSFQWGVNMAVVTTTNLPSGRVTFNPFSITRNIDKASPSFFKDCAAGTIIKQMTVFLTPGPDSSSKNTMTINLFNVFVKNDTLNGPGGGVAPSETVQMIARTYQISYT